MKRTQRLFFALLPGPAVRRSVAHIQRRLDCKARAVSPEQFHITLAFLGNQPQGKVTALKSLAASLDFEPCELQLDRIGTFRRAGVLWLGATTIPPALQAFQRALSDGLEATGIDYDQKQWKPHLTLYRRLRKPHASITFEAVPWRLKGFALVESVGVRNGVRYDNLGRW
jgi:2'-5' RNA ligase